MDHKQRLKFMREWLKALKNEPENKQKEIECLSWAIKQCQKNVDRKKSEDQQYW